MTINHYFSYERMEESENVKIAPVQQKAYKEYLNWVRTVQPDGVIRQALFQYYQEDFDNYVYKLDISGNTHAYTVFTQPSWLDLDGDMDKFISSTKSTKKTNHNPNRIKRLAREMYMRQHPPTNETVEFPIGKLLWNGKSLCVSGQEYDDARFQIEKSDFYSYVSSGESVLREFYDALWENDINETDSEKFEEAFSKLDQRNRLASSYSDFKLWADHYHKVGPVCQLVIKRPDGKHEAYFTKRSHFVLQAPDVHSVSPAGELQTDTVSESSMNQKVIDILGEEILGVPDEMSGSTLQEKKSKQKAVNERVSNAIDNGGIHLRRTAFGFDMCAVKPIFAGLMYVSDPEVGEWMLEELNTGWEAESMKRIELPRPTIPNGMHPDAVSSAGAFAFFEGMRTLEHEFNVDTGLDFELHHSMK